MKERERARENKLQIEPTCEQPAECSIDGFTTNDRKASKVGGEGEEEENEKNKRLTLKMESLLVHSDGECAVVLVIDSYYSSLGNQKEEEAVRRHHPPLLLTIKNPPRHGRMRERGGVWVEGEMQEQVTNRQTLGTSCMEGNKISAELFVAWHLATVYLKPACLSKPTLGGGGGICLSFH